MRIFKRKKRLHVEKISSFNDRVKNIRIMFLLLFVLLIVRSLWLQLFSTSAKDLKNIATQQYQKTFDMSPFRGKILDHKREPLAISINSISLAINPKQFDPTPKQLRQLSKLLSLSIQELNSLADKESYFSWIKRKIPNDLADKVKALDIEGLHYINEPSRYYPQGEYLANVIGYVGIDNSGLFGLEKSYDKFLKAASAKVVRTRDGRGNQLFLNSILAAPEQPGNDLVLTIDHVIQTITEEALDEGVKKAKAARGFAIVSDPHTGRILALANRPTFNPNDPHSLHIENTRNLATSYLFEPGSITKPFLISMAIEKGVITKDTIHNCEKSGRLKIDNRNYIHDDHPREFLTTEEILINSSNICAFKVAKLLTPEILYQTYKQFGFASSKSSLKIPGEQIGYIIPWQKWETARFANISFGQGFLTNGIEIVRAYSVLANGGNLITPYLVEKVEAPNGEPLFRGASDVKEKILSAETIAIMKRILQRVVLEGTARPAANDLFSTAGKTGTAEKIDHETKHYSKTKRVANFAGFAPVFDPHLVVFVAIDEPEEKPYYGGKWAAPVFREIVVKTLNYLNVAPDVKSNMTISKELETPPIHNKNG